jgi:short-subunit dehydrogenase
MNKTLHLLLCCVLGRGRGILVGIVSPGPVDTDMQKAYRANAASVGKPVTMPVITPADSARSLANYIEGLGADQAGRFWSAYTGQEVPW